MCTVVIILCIVCVSFSSPTSTKPISGQILRTEDLLDQLAILTADLLHTVRVRHCLTIVTDDLHLAIFGAAQFRAMASSTTYLLMRVADHEDMLAPSGALLSSLRAAKRAKCDAYFVYLANGIQAERFLRYADAQRSLDTRAKFVLLHDYRLFAVDSHYIWRRFVNVVFVRQYERSRSYERADRANATIQRSQWFELSTVPFPQPIREVFVARRLDFWRAGRFQQGVRLFADKTGDLQAVQLRGVVLPHTPAVAVQRYAEGRMEFSGVEVRICNAIAAALNFRIAYYETLDAAAERWGEAADNETMATGLLGEMEAGRADFALADLYYTPYHLEKLDLSAPYTEHCLTFLTPESLTDNSWQTLVLPFSEGMWAGVLLMLLAVCAVFYLLAQAHLRLRRQEARAYRRMLAAQGLPAPQRPKRFRLYKLRGPPRRGVGIHRQVVTLAYRVLPKEECAGIVDLDLFDTFGDCLLYTYSMLMLVSLPRLPRSWSARVMTGWYWTYCILVVVAYRASLTAILANPAPKLAIDTLKELALSPIECGGWGDQNRQFFLDAIDESSQRIGAKMEHVLRPEEAVQRVAEGRFALYESEFVLQEQRAKRNALGEEHDERESLHIMEQCAIHMPIAVGLERNSPLLRRVDGLVRRLVEAGLTDKWLAEARRSYAASVEEEPQEALMELKKLYGALVALGVGYGLATLAWAGEVLYWRCVVMRRPDFNRYTMEHLYARRQSY